MRFLFGILVGLALWPFEALLLMWGLDVSEHYGFAVPTLGYWQCFGASLGLSLIYGGVTLGHKVQESIDP